MNHLRLLLFLAMLTTGLCASADTYLFAVGVSDYGDHVNYRGVEDLRVASHDAVTLAAFYKVNIPQLHHATLTDSQATRHNVLSGLAELYAQADTNDQIVLFMACHGGRGGFLLHDSSVTYLEIINIMAASPARSKIMFIDACFSGGLQQEGSSTTDQSVVNQYSILCFFSSRDDEVSFESSELDNGIFTTYLMRALTGRADKNDDNTISALELYEYVNPRVAKHTRDQQHPRMWGKFDPQMTVAVITGK